MDYSRGHEEKTHADALKSKIKVKGLLTYENIIETIL